MSNNSKEQKRPRLTAIIAAYNEERHIQACLDSLLAQTEQPLIIVVDDGSTDRTVEIVKTYLSKGVILIESIHIERSAARNKGWRAARTPFVAFCEADAIFSSNWINVIATALEQGAVAVIDRRTPPAPVTWFQRCWDTNFRIRYSHYKPFSAWAFRREVLEDVGGFNEQLTQAEDSDLGRRIQEEGYEIRFVEEAVQTHMGEPRTLQQLLKRAFISTKKRVRQRHSLSNKEQKRMQKNAVAGAMLLLGGCTSFLAGLHIGIVVIGVIVGISLIRTWKEAQGAQCTRRHVLGWGLIRPLHTIASILGAIVGYTTR